MIQHRLLTIVAAHLDEGDAAPLATLEVAVPHYAVRAMAICVERRALSVLGEYILRATASGFRDHLEISGFLGVPLAEVCVELEELSNSFYLTHHCVTGNVNLLEKGRVAISKDGLRDTVLKELPCLVEGVTRRIVRTPPVLVPRKRLSAGTLALPPIPARPPRVDELSLPGFKEAVAASYDATHRMLEVSRLGRIVRATSLFQSGHMMLRRGTHSPPTICVAGAADSELSHHLGAHPALQLLKKKLETQEKQTRYQITAAWPKMRRQTEVDPAAFRAAISQFAAWSRTTNIKADDASREFVQSGQSLMAKSHWAGGDEFQMLFRYALQTVTRRMLLVAPSQSHLLSPEVIEALHKASARGVRVELYINLEDNQIFHKYLKIDKTSPSFVINPLHSKSGWCGFHWDNTFAVVGCSKTITCSMGRTDVFFGAAITGDTESEVLLRDLSLSAAPVTMKRAAARGHENPIQRPDPA